MINHAEVAMLEEALDVLEEGFTDLPAFAPELDPQRLRPVLEAVAARMQDNYPYPHPYYAGQMLKPPHPVARIAYALSMYINPNNHALDGGRASSAMEKECIRDIAAMFGWSEPLGHLTGGGTMANLEALWISDRLHPGQRILASDQAHYTHGRISDVLKIPFAAVASNATGAMDMEALENELEKGDVGTVVATMGTTGLGAVDPLPRILDLQSKYGFRIHADAAYGGYFVLASNLSETTRRRYDAMTEVDSIVIDPHKHGLQPYGCGCVLFKDTSVVKHYKHDSAYTYFSSDDLHLGEISLECSRAGSSAVALWATHRLLPPVEDGEFASSLDRCVSALHQVRDALDANPAFTVLHDPMLDIIVFSVAGDDAGTVSAANQRLFDRAARRNLHLALIEMPVQFVNNRMPLDASEAETVTCLRSVLMKPEHDDWAHDIIEILNELGGS